MRTLFDFSPDGATRALVLLPAAKAKPEDFLEHGFIDAVRERRLPLDIVLPDCNTDRYLDGDVVHQIHSNVIEPLGTQRYAGIWLAGISLGGMGSVAYAASRGGLDGVILLAPFLGLPDAKGEPELLGELARLDMPNIFLGYGMQDRYARTSGLLAQRLPANRVTTVEGGHDWPTWTRLWNLMLPQAFDT
jgi:hypothetical protein